MSAAGHQMTAAAPGTTIGSNSPSAFDAHATNGHATNGHANGNGYSNGNGNGHGSFENEKAHQAPMYNGGSGGANYLSRTLTPGGHYADDDLIAIANGHRRIANPLPLGGEYDKTIPDIAADTVRF